MKKSVVKWCSRLDCWVELNGIVASRRPLLYRDALLFSSTHAGISLVKPQSIAQLRLEHHDELEDCKIMLVDDWMVN